ncbi:MAG TPA: hypothetical protein VLB80_02730 [Candidatus Babeliales bacterium]|nr:hypothetical protein [Candidatus Babeliales bacterium]
MNKKIIIFLVIFSLYSSFNGAILIKGDKDASEGHTFSFNVYQNIFSPAGNFYEGSNEVLTTNQEFSLSRLLRGTNAFMPLIPEIVTLNGSSDVANPLFGDKIIALGMLETEDGFSVRDMPVVVGSHNESTVYLLENINKFNGTIMASSNNTRDALGSISRGIVNLTTNTTSHVFAAVKPHIGEFGDLNSGIALLIRGTINSSDAKNASAIRIFSQVNANTGAIVPPQALQLDPTSPALFIDTILASITQNKIAMHWDNSLESLFVGLNVTANSGITDGARAVAIVKFTENGGITLQEIAPDTVFSPGNRNNIIGAREADVHVSINRLNSMYTSTALNYLITVGSVGDAATVNNIVSALPLVNTGQSKSMIAQKNALPVNIFKNSSVPRLIGRTISEPATTPEEMTQLTDSAAQVGGGPLLAGPISNIIVRDDTVFAFVGENTPGVYSSQAIFDPSGKINSWTLWQRAAGTTDTIFGAALNAFDGNFILASGLTAQTVNTLQKTIWSDGSAESLQPLTAILNTTFALDNGGIQGLQTFLPITPGLNKIAVLAAGGIGTIALAQTGIANSNDIIIPTVGADFNNVAEFNNGIITTDVTATTVIISGGELTNIGPITALEIAATTTNGWLFVGGSNGLAILANSDGTGWDPTTNLGNNFSGLHNGMSFKIIGNYNFVKKLIYDDNFLYVIAHNTVDRINLITSDFSSNNLDVTTIASNGINTIAQTGGFLDGIFSQASGIIATTNGLFRIGNNKDVRIIISESDAHWTPLPIGESAGAPTSLYAVTQTNRAQDITRGNGGYFYVLTANVGIDQSRINRFTVQPLSSTDVMTATTIQPFDDIFVQNIPSFLLSFGEFRSNFATDGALYFATRNQNNIISPIALITPSFPVPRVGVGNVGDRSVPVQINFQQGTEINAFLRSQASGSWIAAGNFNTQVLE